MSSRSLGDHVKFEFNEPYFKWLPVADITTTPHWAIPINNFVKFEDLYSVQVGLKYKFTERSYVLFKTEYATDYTTGSSNFNIIDNRSTLIFQFKCYYL